MELFTGTRKLKKYFLFDNYRCSMCAPPVTRHTSIRYSVSCHTRASTWVNRYSSLLQWSVHLGQRGHVVMLLCVLCTKCTLHSNHRLTVWYSNIPTHKTTSPPGRPFSHYINSHSLAAEMWTTMKNNLLGGDWVVPSICKGFVNTCPAVFLQNMFLIPEYIMKHPVYFTVRHTLIPDTTLTFRHHASYI